MEKCDRPNCPTCGGKERMEETNKGLVQCPKCPRMMGELTRFCAACGTRLPGDPAVAMCNLEFHRAAAKQHLELNVLAELSPEAFCPDCGVKITDCHPDFQTP